MSDDFHAKQDAYAAKIGVAPPGSLPCCKYSFMLGGRWTCPLKNKCGFPLWKGLPKRKRPLSAPHLAADLADMARTLVRLAHANGGVMDREIVHRIWTNGELTGSPNDRPVTILLQLMEEWRNGTLREVSKRYRFTSDTKIPEVE